MLLFSQTNYKAGYIVKDKDTIYGKIDYRNDKNLSERCKFKKGDDVKEYAPFEIDMYRFMDDRLFISKEIDEKKVFLEVLIEGKLNVFTFSEIVGKPRYYVNNDEYSLKEITYAEEEIETDDKHYTKKLNKHIAVLNIFTFDAPSMQSKVNAIEEPSRKNLIKFAKTYHYKVCDTEDCVVYESKPKKIKVITELRFGTKNFTDHFVSEGSLTRNGFFITEALVYFSLPHLGDEWYFKTGVSVLNLTYYRSNSGFWEEDKLYMQIPMQLQYIKNKGILRPKFSYGLSLPLTNAGVRFTNSHEGLTNAGLGLNIKISKKLFVSVDSDFEFIGFFIPKGFYGTNLTGGLVYQF